MSGVSSRDDRCVAYATKCRVAAIVSSFQCREVRSRRVSRVLSSRSSRPLVAFLASSCRVPRVLSSESKVPRGKHRRTEPTSLIGVQSSCVSRRCISDRVASVCVCANEENLIDSSAVLLSIDKTRKKTNISNVEKNFEDI